MPNDNTLECYFNDDDDLFIYGDGGGHGSPAFVIRKDQFARLALYLLKAHTDDLYDLDVFNLHGCVTEVDNENI